MPVDRWQMVKLTIAKHLSLRSKGDLYMILRVSYIISDAMSWRHDDGLTPKVLLVWRTTVNAVMIARQGCV
jgi:hypothetical protein